ncbi:hypothetical protein BRADI_3g03840v3 [Brachypodium distachyon]|uniref:C2H2-type domain-containing protein n=2 Tax=Brachypodium distachyon TaxID=15368 RepID=A0A2K2CV17_BRADI|nr:hypothetical protein BRADI_3g03840v3 [Brachypodium distachyon]
MARDVHDRALSPDDQRRGCSQPQGPLPPPPPLGSSRPKRLVEDDDDDEDQLLLPPPPPLGSSRPKRLDDDDRLLLPPPPPLGSSRPKRLVEDENDDDRLLLPPPPPLRSPRPKRLVEDDRLEADSPRNNGTPRGHGRSPENVYAPLLPAPPAGSSRPGPVVYRLLESESPPDGRSPNPGDGPDSGYGAFSNVHGTERKGLMTYKQFCLFLEDDVSPGEAGSRYQEYKTAYITTQKRAYFDLHKDEIRLKEKYHPTNLLSVIERRNGFCKAAAKDLILDLRTGVLDCGPGMTAGAASKLGNNNAGSSDNDEDYGSKRRKNRRGPQKEPEPLSTAPKAHPISSKYRRIQTDIVQTLALVKKLDAEKGIVGNILSTSDHGMSDVDRSHVGSVGPIVIVQGLSTVKGLEGVELLDTLLTYLWRVHGVDYYGMCEMRDAKGFRHVRDDNKSTIAFNISAADWEKKLDSFWHERLMNGKDPLVVLASQDKIDAATVETLEPYVKKIMDDKFSWKYGCGALGCIKIFHAPEFVHRHLKLKHPELVSELTSKVQEDIYRQNYMNDPNAPGGIPVMQQSAPNRDRIRQIPDEQISGAFDLHGLNAPFAPESLPPPLLIPVPGAGPLGPFVPAPPEMAIQMMEEQRPPRPNGAQHGKPPLMPRPMMPMYPHFPRDPRPLRNYDDLDAPDEEVTVIDYRSL